MTTSVRVIQREEQPDQHHPTAAAAAIALPTVLECALPPGVAIKPNAYGHGLFATQRFESGAILYMTSCLYVPDLPGTIPLRILGTGEEFTLDMKEHSVVQPDKPGQRQLYTFDAFMNHSCAPNTGSVVTAVAADTLEYGMRALRPIEAGEELTCDYTLFEAEAGDAAILRCQCGAGAECLGQVLGFNHLALAQAAPRFAFAEPYVLTSYLQVHPRLAFLDLRARTEGEEQEEQSGATPASVDVVVEGAARLAMAGAGPLPAGAMVAEVTVQHIPSPETTPPSDRQVVVAPATPGAPSFAVAVGDGEEDGDEDEGGLMWPLRAVFKRGAGREGNVRAERVAAGEEEGQVVYRLVALREIADGAPLALA